MKPDKRHMPTNGRLKRCPMSEFAHPSLNNAGVDLGNLSEFVRHRLKPFWRSSYA